jgi:hypothetical protein
VGIALVIDMSSASHEHTIQVQTADRRRGGDANRVDENACRTEQAGISTECFIKIRPKPSAMDDQRQPLGPIQLFRDVQNSQPLTKIPVGRY